MSPADSNFEREDRPAEAGPLRSPEALTALPDEDLVRMCVEGSHDAWCAVIERYRNLIFSIPVKHGLPPEDASEIFQDVCLKLLQHLDRLREPRTLAAWLIKVTSHECIRWRRERPQGRIFEANADSACFRAAAPRPEVLAEELRREQVLRESISGLGERCRELVRMLFFTTPALSYDQVAREFGVARNSVGFIRMRCLKRLRQLLIEKGY